MLKNLKNLWLWWVAVAVSCPTPLQYWWWSKVSSLPLEVTLKLSGTCRVSLHWCWNLQPITGIVIPLLAHVDSAAEIQFSIKKFTCVDLHLVSIRLLVGPLFSLCYLFWCIWAHFVYLTHACSHFSKHIPSKLIYRSSQKESSWFGMFFPHLALEFEPSGMVLCGAIQAPLCFPGFTFVNILSP